jgi:hypothetical protein
VEPDRSAVPALRIGFPSGEEEDRSRRFQVIHFYVVAIDAFLQSNHGDAGETRLTSLIDQQNQITSMTRIRHRPVDEGRLMQALYLSWASEIQLRLGNVISPSLVKYSNAWAPVHAYYAIYMSAQALFISMGMAGAVDSHTAMLNSISNQVRDRQMFPLPWCVSCEGCPQTGNISYRYLPGGVEWDQEIQLLSRPTGEYEDFWPRYCKMLKTTREDSLENRFKEWKQQQRPRRTRMRAAEKEDVADRCSPTTFFDFIWRLRVRSNYKDVSSFLMSSIVDVWQEEFFSCLLRVTEATCCLIQNLVLKYSGERVFRTALVEFMELQRIEVPEIFDPFKSAKMFLLDE